MFSPRVVVRGGGDLGSGVVLRLWRAGFQVVVLEISHPVAVRRTVSFSEAVYEGQTAVEELVGMSARSEAAAIKLLEQRVLPVLIDPAAESLSRLRPDALVDATMAKRNLGTRLGMAPCVISLGPGFEAGVDCDAVVETNRGPHLGRVIWSGRAEPNTGMPAAVQGATAERVLRAPLTGIINRVAQIGTAVECGEIVAHVDEQPITSGTSGMVRGLARDGLRVEKGMKIGDIDPRLDPTLCGLVSDKSLAIAGGVMEAIMMMTNARG